MIGRKNWNSYEARAMGATSLIMTAWPNWMQERLFSSTVSNRSVKSLGVSPARPAGSSAANSSSSGAFVTNVISIYIPLSRVGKLLQTGRELCTIAKKLGWQTHLDGRGILGEEERRS